MLKSLLAALAAALLLAGAVSSPALAAEDATWDGLQKVKSKKLDTAYLLPGADFRGYTKVMIDPLEVAFRKNWERDMNRASRSARQRVSAEDADRIRKELGEGFHEVLVEDFAKAGYEVVTAPGPDVLRLRPGLVDVWINAPDTMQPGRSYTFTVEAGEATLALRFTLSQSVVAAVPPANETVHRLALDLVPAIRPITEAETAKLKALAQTLDPLFPERPRTA